MNDLTTTDPELAKEWSPNNSDTADLHQKISGDYALWICPRCKGEYSAKIQNRQVGDDVCPYCQGKKAWKGFNDLTTTDPELVAEWSNNNPLSPDHYLRTMWFVALWICPRCGGEYSKQIREREVGDDACPYCKGKRILDGYNDFATLHPDLLSEWSVAENTLLGIRPNAVLDTNMFKIWWKCQDCNHKYYMSIKDRLMKQKRGFTACTYCNGRRIKEIHFF